MWQEVKYVHYGFNDMMSYPFCNDVSTEQVTKKLI